MLIETLDLEKRLLIWLFNQNNNLVKKRKIYAS